MREQNRIRGHELVIIKRSCNKDISKYYFSHRVVDKWNNLPRSVVKGECLDLFKIILNKFMLAR